MERWKWVVGGHGKYKVSNRGRVRSVDREVPFKYRGEDRVYHCEGKIIAPNISHKGYYQLGLNLTTGKKKNHLVHRLVAEAFVPNPDNLPEVNHKDSNKKNNRPSNLEWVTRLENAQHAVVNGRYRTGTNNKRSKLNWKKVIRIRRLRRRGMTLRSLAEKFYVSYFTVYAVVKYLTWKP